MLLLCFFLIITLVKHNAIVVNGARFGLMLWYQNVIPLLLPFMIISNLCLLQAKRNVVKHPSVPFFYTILLGTLCGYPLGAKCTADFTKNHLLDKKIANLLLPLCNNVSPMFLSGYILHFVLNNILSLKLVLILLYIPYICIFLISYIALHKIHFSKKSKDIFSSNNFILNSPNIKNTSSNYIHQENSESLLLNSIQQITYVGIYIMICSIIVNLIFAKAPLNDNTKSILAGITEITQGSLSIYNSTFETRIKIALILGMTSFGGVSSILQTYQVIKQSGLSLTYYIIVKLLCGMSTGICCYLLVV